MFDYRYVHLLPKDDEAFEHYNTFSSKRLDEVFMLWQLIHYNIIFTIYSYFLILSKLQNWPERLMNQSPFCWMLRHLNKLIGLACETFSFTGIYQLPVLNFSNWLIYFYLWIFDAWSVMVLMLILHYIYWQNTFIYSYLLLFSYFVLTLVWYL